MKPQSQHKSVAPSREILPDNNYNPPNLQTNIFEAKPRQMRTWWDEKSLFESHQQPKSDREPELNIKKLDDSSKDQSKHNIEEDKYQFDSDNSKDYNDDEDDEEGTRNIHVY